MQNEVAKIDTSGRILLPAAFRRELNVQPGDDVLLVLGNDSVVRVLPVRAAIREAQAVVRRYVPVGTRLSDELIRERRAEAVAETDISDA
ncbi:MAG TPA: AbrB/MazE/SpoVT family DNA-binding domain-containing protein [Chloroflexota bacterium]|nr:AbrB/MazE/SpoVT family DNA-binding domain-containing protein [Chloroflexota bacterium]